MNVDPDNGKQVRERADRLAQQAHQIVNEAQTARNITERAVVGMAAALQRAVAAELDLAAIITETKQSH